MLATTRYLSASVKEHHALKFSSHGIGSYCVTIYVKLCDTFKCLAETSNSAQSE